MAQGVLLQSQQKDTPVETDKLSEILGKTGKNIKKTPNLSFSDLRLNI